MPARPGCDPGDKMSGKTCAGTWVTGPARTGQPRRGVPVPRGRQRDDHGARRLPGRRLQTAINPVVAMELLAAGTWSGAGVLGPEALTPRPFLDLLVDYGSPTGDGGALSRCVLRAGGAGRQPRSSNHAGAESNRNRLTSKQRLSVSQSISSPR